MNIDFLWIKIAVMRFNCIKLKNKIKKTPTFQLEHNIMVKKIFYFKKKLIPRLIAPKLESILLSLSKSLLSLPMF